MGGVFLISGQYERAQFTEGGAVPVQMVLGCVREQTEQATNKQAISHTLPWFLLQF